MTIEIIPWEMEGYNFFPERMNGLIEREYSDTNQRVEKPSSFNETN